ncbi:MULTISPECIES: four helix bundle protein [unclassified Fibrobacter]|uniref:four helix bundle protein n=1 Tax=unclassified Fibrobacter TaxID=2634177 RepID=UPI000934508D|nr:MULTISPECIES: four helix bundle protein [Fibrobacter]
MRNRVLENKCLAFAIRIVNLHQFLQQTSKEFVLSKQILRSGTSIGANVAEAIYAQSRADFFSKIGIAKKEAAETVYWLKLLQKTNYIDSRQFDSMNADNQELLKILTAISKSCRCEKPSS